MQAHPNDGFVQAEGCRSISRLATARPEVQGFFLRRGGAARVVEALLEHPGDRAVQLQVLLGQEAPCMAFFLHGGDGAAVMAWDGRREMWLGLGKHGLVREAGCSEGRRTV